MINRTRNLKNSILALLAFVSTAAATPRAGQMVELKTFLNSRSEAKFRKSDDNKQFILFPGTKAIVKEVKEFPQNRNRSRMNYGVCLQVMNVASINSNDCMWVYHVPGRPSIEFFDLATEKEKSDFISTEKVKARRLSAPTNGAGAEVQRTTDAIREAQTQDQAPTLATANPEVAAMGNGEVSHKAHLEALQKMTKQITGRPANSTSVRTADGISNDDISKNKLILPDAVAATIAASRQQLSVDGPGTQNEVAPKATISTAALNLFEQSKAKGHTTTHDLDLDLEVAAQAQKNVSSPTAYESKVKSSGNKIKNKEYASANSAKDIHHLDRERYSEEAEPTREALATIDKTNDTVKGRTACTHCSVATAGGSSIIRGRQFPESCSSLMSEQGDIGPWGQSLINAMSQPKYRRYYLDSRNLRAYCPKFGELSDSDKLKAWTWFWTVLAKNESTCNPKITHATHYRKKNGEIKRLNPRYGYGLWALEKDNNYRREHRGQACYDISSPSGQALCSVDIMVDRHLSQGNTVTDPNSYWGPVRRANSQIIPHMRRLSLCY